MSVARVEGALARLALWQPVTNAFSQVWTEEALEAGDAAERAVASGGASGPLHGVPVAVKDLYDVAGFPTTGCSRVYEGRLADVDAPLVTRLREAGAILVGKTNQHELAMGATNLVSAGGPTANPWDPQRITGGSSGGSGAAVASGVVSIALGTDTGGSIRIPASMCGTFGLKPTHGRLPLEGVMPLAPSLDCPGPMAATTGELVRLWNAIAEDTVAPVNGVPTRVGVLGGHFARRVHPDCAGAVAATALALQGLGAELIEIDGDGIEDALELWVDLVCDEMAAAHPQAVANRERCHPRIAGFLARGINVTAEERAAISRRVREIRAWFDERLEGVDVLLAPTTPYPAPRVDQDEVDVGGGERVDVPMGGTSIFTRPVSLSGLPSIAVPAGTTAGGLPLSAQLIAPAGAEVLLLQAAVALEASEERFRTALPPLPDLS